MTPVLKDLRSIPEMTLIDDFSHSIYEVDAGHLYVKVKAHPYTADGSTRHVLFSLCFS